MQPMAATDLLRGYLNLDGGEIILILAIVLILFGAKKLPELAHGLGRGIDKFRDNVAEEASKAGRSAGGIYGKRAAQALTPDNQVAELYYPTVLKRKERPRTRARMKARFLRLWRMIMTGWKRGI